MKMITTEQTNYLLTDNNGIANYYHTLLCFTKQHHKAQYFRDTIQVWNPTNTLANSILATSSAFFADEYKTIDKFASKPMDQYRPLMMKVFRDWYNLQHRKQARRYNQCVTVPLGEHLNHDNMSYNNIIQLEEIMNHKSIYELIGDFIENHATERERFIYRSMVGLDDLVYDDDYRYVLNYPYKSVTRQTFAAHKRKLMHALRGLTLKATSPKSVKMTRYKNEKDLSSEGI